MAATKTGTLVKVWKDSTNAYAAVSVAEGGSVGNVEYIASTPLLKADNSAKNAAELKADIAAAVTAQRVAQLDGPSAVAGVFGNVSV